MERNASLFPDTTADIRKQLSEMRTDPKARRDEALNMALMEAGLRIAASNNPRLAGAIGEGATPALQAYSQQTAQIRQDQRADIKDQLAIAQADLQRQYLNGQISGAELRARTQLLVAQMQERGANARAAATLARSDRADVAGVPAAMNATRSHLANLNTRLENLGAPPREQIGGGMFSSARPNPDYAAYMARRSAIEREIQESTNYMSTLRDMLEAGRPRQGASPRVGGGTPNVAGSYSTSSGMQWNQ
jgi:hypothetical protein